MKEMETFLDRGRFQRKDRDRDRDFSKRRKYGIQQRSTGDIGIDNDASDEEYHNDEEERSYCFNYQKNQPSPHSSSLSSHRRNLRTLRSAPILRTAIDDTIGVAIPRRARSITAKRLHDCEDLGSGKLDEELSCRRISPANENLNGASVFSPTSSCASNKKNNRYAEPKTRYLKSSSDHKLSSVIQDDIEREVVEALFDLMRQSHSLSQNPKNCADEDTETVTNESNQLIKEPKKEGRNGFLREEKVASPRESKSISRARVDGLRVQTPVVTKAKDKAAPAIPTKKDTRIEIDLTSPPPLPVSPEKDVLFDWASVMKNVTLSSDGALAIANQREEKRIATICSNQWTNLNLEKSSKKMSRVGNEGKQQDQKKQKEQLETSLLPFPIAMSGWPSGLPHIGYMTPLPAVHSIDGNVRLSTAVQPPKFKFSEPKQKKSATHQYIARNIYIHQQLLLKSLLHGFSGAGTLYGSFPLNPNSLQQMQRLISGNNFVGSYQGNGRDIASGVAAATKATKNEDITLQSRTSNFLHGPAFTIPLDHLQTAAMAPGILQGAFQSASACANISLPANSARRSSVNLSPHPEHFIVNDIGLSMATGERTGLQAPQVKGAAESPPVPVFNSSFYSSASFNVSQGQNMSLHLPVQQGAKFSVQSSPLAAVHSIEKLEADNGEKGSASFAQSLVPNGLSSSFPIPPMYTGTLLDGAIAGLTSNTDSGKNLTQVIHSSIFSKMGSADKSSKSLMASPVVDDLMQSFNFNPVTSFFQKSGFPGIVVPQFPKQCSIQMQQAGSAKLKASNTCSVPSVSPNKQVSVSASSFQGQDTVTNNQSLTAGLLSESHSSRITQSTIGNVDSTVSVQTSEASPNEPCQQSSPACGRNMPTILCASQLSGLKY